MNVPPVPTTAGEAGIDLADIERTAPGRPAATARRLLRNVQGAACFTFLALVALAGLLSPLLAPYRPNYADITAVNALPFSVHHVLGTDGSGRDILSRLLLGTRETLVACLIIVSVAVPIGVTAGLLAGFYRGKGEAIANWLSDVILSLPGIVLLIALYTLTGPNVLAAMAVFGILVSPSYFRLVRAIVIRVRHELYVDAARVTGLSDRRIMRKHVLPAVRGPVVIQSAFVLAAGIAIEAGIDYLGLGSPTTPSWGGVLQEAFTNIYNNRDSVIWPSVLITLTILALVLLGNALRDVLQVTERGKTLSARARQRAAARAHGAAPSAPKKLVRVSADVVLAVRGLRVGYPDPSGATSVAIRDVVHGVDLDVKRGEIHGLVGESGSGKSQIVFATLGILPRDAVVTGGSIALCGQDLLRQPALMRQARGRRIAYVPQEPMSNLDPSFTIGAQLTYGLRALTQLTKQEARVKLLALLSHVGIHNPEKVFNLYPHQISGGMAQRVLICGALAGDPELIVADEPTTALDVCVQAEVIELLRQLRDERGLSMVLVTHNLGVVADICDSVSVMRSGMIVERGEVGQLFRTPNHEYTRDLLESSRRVELAVT